MSSLIRVRRALLSVSDKTDLIAFARELREMDIEIISTGGTARALADAGIDVTPVSDVTGFPEIMDGRVKTLHPAIHGALLGRRDLETHTAAMREHAMAPIDLVCINLYPFEQTVRKANVSDDEAIEQIDIGGPAMLRSAAKNHDFVAVLTTAHQYDRVVNELREHEGCTTIDLRRELAEAAFMRTAEYDTNISAWMSSRRGDAFPALLRLSSTHQAELRYGENPHQRAALYADPAASGANVVSAHRLCGKPLSYNNINDAAAALALVQDLADTFPDDACATLIKHTNPCGAAAAPTAAEAFDLAYAGDPMAAFGGVLALSRPVDDSAAEQIAEGERFLEVIIAPAFDDAAATRLGERWRNVRLLSVGVARPNAGRIEYRSIPGGMLVQERDAMLARPRDWRHAAGPDPSEALLASAAFIFTVVKHLTSNAIAIGAGRSLLGAGAGQMDRVAACRIAIEKAAGKPAPAAPLVAASDAFFPFKDGPETLIDAGATCLVHPGGSKRDDETLALCNERGVTCLLTGVRHFRH